MSTTPTTRENTINRIAREALGIKTLETRHSDGLDFHDIAVWTMKDALERAYEAGRKAAPPSRTKCPTCHRDIEIRPIPPLT
ncbi:MAG: hypothetical protein EA378_09350 [Phycisphaerales bacterium]|nr:MAG: hypothetical protein EA378_09350 [Phycisphaerales bacterium]